MVDENREDPFAGIPINNNSAEDDPFADIPVKDDTVEETPVPTDQQSIPSQQSSPQQPISEKQPEINQDDLEGAFDTGLTGAALQFIAGLFKSSESVRARVLDFTLENDVKNPKQFIEAIKKNPEQAKEMGITIGRDIVQGAFGDVGDKSDERIEFGDVLEERGANKVTKTLGGLALEIATDPLSYLGGSVVAKKAGKTVAGTAKEANIASNISDLQKNLVQLKGNKTANEFNALIKNVEDELTSLQVARDDLPVQTFNERFSDLSQQRRQLSKEKVLNELVDFENADVKRTSRAFSLASTFIEKRGKSGKALARQIERASDNADGLRARFVTRIEPQGDIDKVVRSLNDTQRRNLVASLDGFATPDPSVEHIIKAHKQNWDEIGGMANRRGMQVQLPDGTKVPFTGLNKNRQLPHFTINPEKLIKTPKRLQDILEYNVDIGRFANVDEAADVFNSYRAAVAGHIDDELGIAINPKTEKFFKWIQSREKLSSLEEAERKFRSLLSKDKDTRFGNLEFARSIEIPFYEIDPSEVLSRYYSGASKRISEVDAFGLNNEIADSLIARIADEVDPEDAAFIKENITDVITGKKRVDNLPAGEALAQGLRNIQVSTKLGRAVVFNLTQSKNTAAITGVRNTVNSMREAFTREGQEFAAKAGAVFNEFTRDIYGATSVDPSQKVVKGLENISNFVLDKTGFSSVEKFNRVAAAVAGKNYAKDLATELIATKGVGKRAERLIKELQKMDINVDKVLKNGGIAEEDLLQAARNMATRTQFRARVQDSPVWANSTWGKVVNQFKNFIENETKFIRKELLAEAKDGNYAPLVRYLSIAPIAGMSATKVKEFVSDTVVGGINALTGTEQSKRVPEKLTQTKLEELVDAAGTIGAFGIYYDILQNILYNRDDFVGNLVPATKTVGEIGSGLVEAVRPFFNEDSGKLLNLKPLTKSVFRATPVIGPDLFKVVDSDKVKQRRFTRAASESLKKELGGANLATILNLAEESGVDADKVLKGAQRSRKAKERNKRKFEKALDEALKSGQKGRAIALVLGLADV